MAATEEHFERLRAMATEWGDAMRRNDDEAADRIFNEICDYAENQLGAHAHPVMVIRVTPRPTE